MGVWEGAYQNQNQHWLRWWDGDGNLLPRGSERAETERQRAEDAERGRAAEARSRREAVPRLLEMGLTPEQIAEALGLPLEEVRSTLG